MTTKQFYKMPADLLQTDCVQKMLKSEGALSQFGLTMLMWFTIQGSREKKVSRNILQNMYRNISSCSQRNKVLDSGMFLCDTESEIVTINPKATHASGHTPEHAGEHAPEHTAEHTPEHYSEDLDIEVEENTRETTASQLSNSLIRDLKNTQPDRGELWEGVLLCCPDQELRKLMVEHWPETVDYLTKHLEARSTEVTDQTSLCNILRELVQPSSLVFNSLKLFLSQEVKSEAEKAFDRWLSNLNNICLMHEPLTFKQFNELVQICHDGRMVKQKVERLNNYSKTPTRYVSAFQTIKDWIENPQ